MQLYSFYDNKEFLKDYCNIVNVYVYEDTEDFQRKYGPIADVDAFSSWLRVGRFFDGVGILIKRNLIERDLIFELLGDVIRRSWEGFESGTGMGRWLKEGRELWDRPLLWLNFEYLYHELMNWYEGHPELKT